MLNLDENLFNQIIYSFSKSILFQTSIDNLWNAKNQKRLCDCGEEIFTPKYCQTSLTRIESKKVVFCLL